MDQDSTMFFPYEKNLHRVSGASFYTTEGLYIFYPVKIMQFILFGKLFMQNLKGLYDRQVLRTGAFAGTAFYAVGGIRKTVSQCLVFLAGNIMGIPSNRMGVIVCPEAFRNVHPVGAGHAVIASSAVNELHFFPFGCQIIYE